MLLCPCCHRKDYEKAPTWHGLCDACWLEFRHWQASHYKPPHRWGGDVSTNLTPLSVVPKEARMATFIAKRLKDVSKRSERNRPIFKCDKLSIVHKSCYCYAQHRILNYNLCTQHYKYIVKHIMHKTFRELGLPYIYRD